ncbi:MAG: 2-thiouracil desulfurase family protein [Sphaerochaetaceae bacterium]|nr:2-thiouracil desulfurase family protein [Sphaerochaetaceae bacterium]
MKNNERTVAVSSCLLGENCKYNGGNNRNTTVQEMVEDCRVISVCPEMLGGLPCPRVPAEIRDGRVVTGNGEDVDSFFRIGAEKALEAVKEADLVILQPRSPSCGLYQVYDGSFSGSLVPGSGVFASLLRKNGINAVQAFEIRKTTEEDFREVMEIYAEARAFMAEHGNPNQWGPTVWPPESLIHNDIREGKSYVCLSSGRIAGVFYFDFGEDIESTYRNIEEGSWIDDSAYGVVHRIATRGEIRGAGRFCIEWAFSKTGHLRIDTHPDNSVMQRLLKSSGFKDCGIIHVVEDNYPRIAFERV